MSNQSEPRARATGPIGGERHSDDQSRRRPHVSRETKTTVTSTGEPDGPAPGIKPAPSPIPRRRGSSRQAVGVAAFVVLVFSVGALFAWRAEAPSTERTAVARASSGELSGTVASGVQVPDNGTVGLGEADNSPAKPQAAQSLDFEFVPGFTRRDFDPQRHAANRDRPSRPKPAQHAGSQPDRPAPLAQQFGNSLPSGIDGTSTATSTTSNAATNAGGIIADFDPLIELIENTIEVDTWDPVGLGTMQEFESGVSIDPSGVMRLRIPEDAHESLEAVRASLAGGDRSGTRPALGRSPLRKISLLRLMAEVRRHLDAGEPLPEAVRYLSGLTAVRYVFVYPEQHDIVLAGPAEEWRRDEFGRAVGASSGHAVLELDDLLALVQAFHNGSSVGCSIDPRQEGLRQFKEHLVASRDPVPPGRRDQWVEELRDRLGLQDISVWGVPAGSHVARVLVEADYRMKLIGFDLVPTIAEIPSYFDLLEQNPAARRQSLDSLRWWFTLHYDSVVANAQGTAFELVGSPVRLLSENEFLTLTGQRVHTGKSDPTNTRFAQNFTDHFAELADADPVFSALGGVFNLAVVAALMEEHALAERAGWPAVWLAHGYPVPQGRAPETVESVMNYRAFSSREFSAAVSGGASIEPGRLVRNVAQSTDTRPLSGQHAVALRAPQADLLWWWD